MVIENTLQIIEKIDGLIYDVGKGTQGNKRVEWVSIKKGSLIINTTGDSIYFSIDSKYAYSQLGADINIAGITVRTDKVNNLYKVILKKDYSGVYDIKFNNEETLKKIDKSPTPYTLSILNAGETGYKETIIEIDIS